MTPPAKPTAPQSLAGIPVARTVGELRREIAQARAKGRKIGFVPTMGALHEGHVSLARISRARGAFGVVSIFVNPTQFAPTEDFNRYPRTEEADATKLRMAEACDLLFIPSPAEMYPKGFATHVAVGGPSEGLETDFRPHFFGGVATVVTKLLTQVGPDFAVFGEKDYQQLLVIKRLVADLNLPVEIVPGFTVREPDGLAMSSRNAYLSADERATAASMNRVLMEVGKAARRGMDLRAAEKMGEEALIEAGFQKVDYVAIRDAATLAILTKLDGPARVLAAAHLGKTRLIDNLGI
ncbi:MAG TPA: pantoate--beta-alanine ligase [Micropepsaceae bacterium]|nr:pantoate--beta-alanine ligase [Micropepsaceae bacterium]